MTKGKLPGVFIPIQDRDHLKSKYEGIDEDAYFVPEWQKIIHERIKNTKAKEFLPWEAVREQTKSQANISQLGSIHKSSFSRKVGLPDFQGIKFRMATSK